MKDYLLRSLNKQSLIEIIRKKEIIIDKALDKLYCYGEVFDGEILQEFQKDMENILKGEDNNEKID